MWRYDDYTLCHWGIKGMKWGVRRYQNKDGTLTAAGRKYYGDGNAGEEAEPKVEYAPKRTGGKAEEYSDEELRSRIQRLQMEKQYRDLQGDTNKELKAEKERLQLQKDVKQLRKDVYEGQSFVKDIMKNAGQQALTTMVKGTILYAGQQGVKAIFKNADFANAVGTGGLEKEKKE